MTKTLPVDRGRHQCQDMSVMELYGRSLEQLTSLDQKSTKAYHEDV